MASNDISSAPVAVITGGARGIGLAVGEWFLAQGHRVALLDIDAATLEATGARLAQPDRVLAVPECDEPHERIDRPFRRRSRRHAPSAGTLPLEHHATIFAEDAPIRRDALDLASAEADVRHRLRLGERLLRR